MTSASFTEGQQLIFSPWNHASMGLGSTPPVGKGVLHVDSTRVTVEAQYFLMTEAGRAAFEIVKELGPGQEWSFGYRVEDQGPITIDGRQVNHLKQVSVYEASPVWAGEGIDTRTLDAKTEALHEFLRFIRDRWVPEVVPGLAAAREAVAIDQVRFIRDQFLAST
jgi:hypothetical protein